MFDFRRIVREIREAGLARNEDNIRKFEARRKELGDFPNMKKGICNISAGASDSGFAEIGIRGGSVFLLKSIGVLFSYRDGKLSGHNYFPSKSGKKEHVFIPNLDDAESRIFIELKRLNAEWESLIETVEKGCDIALFDGSLVPLPSYIPNKESAIFEEYKRLDSVIKHARSLASTKRTIIAGVVKDSRSSRLCEMLGIKSSDSVLMENALGEGEATPPLAYSNERKDVLFSYLKTGKNLVFRIEWFADYLETPLQKVYDLCNVSGYRYPPPLVEADLRAMIRKNEFESVEKAIKSYFPSLVRIRERRPFR
ncbi:MAG: DNA double-strand break repair nuclease NurA [Candidatus Micrarchaeota archaeon]|nr:DNA double-strand break repair nuclease NurA [Candidatus Micrarchaeota archaeon]